MPTQSPPKPKRDPHKVTARILELRLLIAQGVYPDRNLLASRIVDATI